MNDDQTDVAKIEHKLEIIIKLLALTAAPDNLPLKERAIRLPSAGLAPKEIAVLCRTTPNTVSVALSTAKRSTKARRPAG